MVCRHAPSKGARRRSGRPTVPVTETLEVRLALSGVTTTADEESGSRSAPAATPQAAVGDKINFLRTFNPNAQLHFFTTREPEYANVLNAGFQDESSGRSVFAVLQNVDPGALAIQRLYNPNTGEHYYTLNTFERDNLVSLGWTAEGTEGAAFTTAQAGTTEIFHVYNAATGATSSRRMWASETAWRLCLAGRCRTVWDSDLRQRRIPPSSVANTVRESDGGRREAVARPGLVGHLQHRRDHCDCRPGWPHPGGAGRSGSADQQHRGPGVQGRRCGVEGEDGAFFGNNEAPLTSRTIRNISQTTLTQSEIESNPNDPARRGPGFVGIVGVGGHFLPGVTNVPHVDLFGIEHTNRDSRLMPGADGIKGNGDDVALNTRFNAEFISGKEIIAPESFGRILLPGRTESKGRRTMCSRPTASCRRRSRAGLRQFRAECRSTRMGYLSAGSGCSSPDRTGMRRSSRGLYRGWGNPMPSD